MPGHDARAGGAAPSRWQSRLDPESKHQRTPDQRERGKKKNRPIVETVGNHVGVMVGIMLAFWNLCVTSVLVSRISRLES